MRQGKRTVIAHNREDELQVASGICEEERLDPVAEMLRRRDTRSATDDMIREALMLRRLMPFRVARAFLMEALRIREVTVRDVCSQLFAPRREG